MDIRKAAAWLRQSSTIAGLTTLAATLAAVAAGEMTWTAAAPALVSVAIGLLLPDNALAKDSATKAAAIVLSKPGPAAVAAAIASAAAIVAKVAGPAGEGDAPAPEVSPSEDLTTQAESATGKPIPAVARTGGVLSAIAAAAKSVL